MVCIVEDNVVWSWSVKGPISSGLPRLVIETSLLRRLQAQTFPDETLQIIKNNPLGGEQGSESVLGPCLCWVSAGHFLGVRFVP